MTSACGAVLWGRGQQVGGPDSSRWATPSMASLGKARSLPQLDIIQLAMSPQYVVMAAEVVTIGPVVGPLLGPEALREASQPMEVPECYEHRNLRTGSSGTLLAFANGKVPVGRNAGS